MAKYKFENHAVELIDPTIIKVSTSFSIGDEMVVVLAQLESNGNKVYGVELGLMPNTEGWTDSDVMAFANTALSNFLVE